MSEVMLRITPDGVSRSAAPAAGRWLPIRVAAAIANRNADAMRRACAETWLPLGLARQVKLASGQTGWEVHESADPAFAAHKTPEVLTAGYRDSAEFRALPEKIRKRALNRETLLDAWARQIDAGRQLKIAEPLVTQRFVAEQRGAGAEKISRATLYNWRKAYRTTGLRGLVDEWGRHKPAGTDEFFRLGSDLWLTTQRRTAQFCYDTAHDTAEGNGWAIPSCRDFRRKLAAIPKGIVAKRRYGKDAFTATAEPSHLRDYSTIAANDWWCADDHRLDVMVRDGTDAAGKPRYTRPWLHAWEDHRSRRVVAWTLSIDPPRATDVLRCFAGAVREHGVPLNVLVDNGKHFDARVLQGVTKGQRRRGKRPESLTPEEMARVGGCMNLLGVKITHATPYRGQSKPIERLFGTLCSRFSKRYEAYTGNSAANRPDALKRALERGDVLTLDEMRGELTAWITDDYNARPHTGHAMDGRTPDEVYRETRGEVRRVSDEQLEFAARERTTATVNKNGVVWRGNVYGWSMAPLLERLGKKVLLAIDERATDHVYVLDLDGSLVCRAPIYGRVPHGYDKELMRDRDGMSMAAVRRFVLRERNDAGIPASDKKRGGQRSLATIDSIVEDTTNRIGVYLDMPGSQFNALVDGVDNVTKRRLVELLQDTRDSFDAMANAINARLPKPARKAS